MTRFVILEHDWPERHWDFMLEMGESLRTWRLERFPEQDLWIQATPLPDHRLAYLDYEGPVSGNRGSVVRREAGEYRLTADFPLELWAEVTGQTLVGRIRILREPHAEKLLFQLGQHPTANRKSEETL